MALNTDDVLVALTGGVFHAAAGTTLPTDAISARDAALTAGEIGYVAEDGVTQQIDETTTKIRAWQNGDTVREVQTAHDLMFSFTAIESNENVLDLFYGNYSAGKVEVNAAQGKRGVFVIEVADGDNDIRIVIPDGQVTDRGDITYVNGAAIGYPVTITCYPDPNYAGALDQPAKAYIYIDRTAS